MWLGSTLSLLRQNRKCLDFALWFKRTFIDNDSSVFYYTKTGR
jgi:hypothetical protein